MDRTLILDPAACALVVIDLQRGIVASPTAPHAVDDVVANAARLADALRGVGGLVVLVRVSARADGKDALRPTLDPDSQQPAAARAPDWAELVPALAGHADDLVLTKRQWGAFYGTELDLQLRRRGVRTIVLCGISTNVGVESTARDAYERGYDQVFVEDAMAARSAEEHAHSVTRIFPRIGRIRSTAEVVAALRPAR
ncbi:hydrolase [Anaeromyxobacter oryzae]|uniref:Isochorismatase family protein n=1 Tax=Anaeromyxobacter oryzae TaxID=2918170 RepID=A0ABM7WPM1_9BACT|nr:hydrolase [Anaeromyxobacter oryzae]BDG01406.1 putative isochorismatase family protein [Anaeromyxobacter oryzae]